MNYKIFTLKILCYYFDDIISLNKKLYENISVYNIS